MKVQSSPSQTDPGIFLGIDIGSVSVKLAALSGDRRLFQTLAHLPTAKAGATGTALPEGPGPAGAFQCVPIHSEHSSLIHHALLLSTYRRIYGDPTRAAFDLIREFCDALGRAMVVMGEVPPADPLELITRIRVTGSGAKLVTSALHAVDENEFKAIAIGTSLLYPDVQTIFEMGGQSSKFIRIEREMANELAAIVDYETNGDCAAGTGSFLDQQATRMRYQVEDIGGLVADVESPARVAGRCSVFAKSDMIHAQQKGFTPPQILKGLCDAVARNFKGSITKSKKVVPQVAFIGGVSQNSGVVESMKELFEFEEDDFFVPAEYAWLGAVGAAALSCMEEKQQKPGIARPDQSEGESRKIRLEARSAADLPTQAPLSMDDVLLLRHRARSYQWPTDGSRVRAYLGVDIGSVSTNLTLLDDEGNLLKEIYLRTESRPIEVVNNGLREIRGELGDRVDIAGVGTTGSGRELIGELIGADTINDEITAHKTGAMHISETLIGEKVDTIFEIGGQDSKYISIDDGIVVDFAMNEACAAGTGSFLEEQAEKLGIKIKEEFSRLALSSTRPVRLGERCTVFMEQDVTAFLQRGAEKKDLVAGLAYSIALNYLNRVVRGRKIGDVIYFQGGTAYNDSVAAAFSKILNKRIVVPPHNGVIGAVGMSLLARDRIRATNAKTHFRGYDLEQVDYTLREFVCRACSNYCDMQEFKVDGVKTYWGDKCSDKFRKRAKVEHQPVIRDLIDLREQYLLEGYEEPVGGRITIGMPRAISYFEQFPLWNRFFRELGCDVQVSEKTNRKIAQDGIDLSVAEPCYPVRISHGHVQDLLDKKVDFIFLPNILDSESMQEDVEAHLCPWNQTLPFVIQSAPGFEEERKKLMIPTIHFGLGPDRVARELEVLAEPLKKSKSDIRRAFHAGRLALQSFINKLQEEGQQAIRQLKTTGEGGIILVGRYYNLYDRSVNLDIPGKLKDLYGVNVIPQDFLPLDEIDIRDINDNMFWNSGRRILAAAKLARDYPKLHLIYITNFKCGPDSFIKHFVNMAANKPFLALQFDGHSNDAGFLTRCEAYLHSKGMIQ
ncbi:MAG: acyl-CoA dehydratase activase [Acidobacteriia bacterium]|nr:acyl-CoA dehydratase activase [Terriglobia bacterium]